MSRGNSIILSSNPKGQFVEGTIDSAVSTAKPGHAVQIKAATEFVGGRPFFQLAAPGTDGEDIVHMILIEDNLQGFTMTSTFAAGTRARAYVPIAGEEMNIRVGEVAGTGNTFAIGDQFMINASGGYYIPATGSPPQSVAFVCMETEVQVAGQSLIHCVKT